MKLKIITLVLAFAAFIAILTAYGAEPQPVVVKLTATPTATPVAMPEPTTKNTPVPTFQPTPKPTPAPALEPAYTEEELEILAIIIYQEAGGDYCSDDTRQMVGEVFLNRVSDSRFPDNFEAVATAPWQYGRLSQTGIVWPERASQNGEAHAVQRAYDCAEALLFGSAERLLPTETVWQAEFPQGTEILICQDGFYFCR